MYTLRQLKGKRAIQGGQVQEIAHPMDEILVEDQSKRNGWRRLGFISRHDGAGIIFHHGLSEGEKQEARDAVEKLRAESNDWKVADKYSTPVDPPEVEEEEYDDDE